jgi:integration host factor subunit beta
MGGGKYTKFDLINSIYDSTGIDRQDIKTVVDLTLRQVKDAIVGGYTVELRGFGTFEVRVRKGRARARNPRTGESVTVKSHGVAYWKPGRDLKREAWNLPDKGDEAPPDVGAAANPLDIDPASRTD